MGGFRLLRSHFRRGLVFGLVAALAIAAVIMAQASVVTPGRNDLNLDIKVVSEHVDEQATGTPAAATSAPVDLDAQLPPCPPIVLVPAVGTHEPAPMDAPVANCDVREKANVKGPEKAPAPLEQTGP